MVVEAAVFGREIECGVLEGHGTDATRTSELGECIVVQNHEFYDYEAKYLAEGDVRLETPGRRAGRGRRRRSGRWRPGRSTWRGARGWRGSTSSSPRPVTCSSTRSTRCRGSRRSSMYPRMWAASGLTYPELIDELIALALERRTGLR